MEYDFVQLISNLGFPVVVCGALFWYILKKDTEHKEELSNYSEKLEKVTDALNANTTVIAELRTLLNKKEG